MRQGIVLYGYGGGDKHSSPARRQEAIALFREAIPYYLTASRLADELHMKHHYVLVAASFASLYAEAYSNTDFESFIMVTETHLVEAISDYEFSVYCPVQMP